MEKQLCNLFLSVLLLTGCHQPEAGLVADTASKLVGSYTLTWSYLSYTNTTNFAKSGSLMIRRTGPSSVHGMVKLDGKEIAFYGGDWALTSSMLGDTIGIYGGNCGCQYFKKQLSMDMADGTIQLRFKKDD